MQMNYIMTFNLLVILQQQVSGLNLKALDDLYIDDEGDDDIQLADEASGLGPLKPGKKNIG